MTTSLTTYFNSLIIIDSTVTDWQSLADDASPDVAILVLDAERDGINQITELVANYSNLDAIHIISHGNAGSLLLGSATINNDNIASYAVQLASIGTALSTGGDILLYGCNVAQGDSGIAFINRFAFLTGADVAASANLKGDTAQGGDWILEQQIGDIEAFLPISNTVLANYGYTLVNSAPTGGVTITNPTPVTSGVFTQGDILTATNTIVDADKFNPLSLVYIWTVGGVVVSGTAANGGTYTLGQTDVGKIITVTATYIDNKGTKESVASAPTSPVINANDAPTGGLFINNDTPSQGDTLIAIDFLADADGIGAITYTWKDINGFVLGTGPTYTLGQQDVGKAITVTASYTDGFQKGESVISAATAPVIDLNDAPTGSLIIDNLAPKQGDLLTAVNTLVDADGIIPASVTYTWQADGAVIVGATGNTYILSQSDVNKAITVTVNYADGVSLTNSITSGATAAVINVNDAPTGGVIITNTTTPNAAPQQNDTLTADASSLGDLDGLGTITYTWKADGNIIVGATSATYTLGQSDVNKAITVTASYTDGGNKPEAVTSLPTAAVINVNDKPTGIVTIDKLNPLQGQTLTASNTLADIDGMNAVSYAWNADGIAIAGATGKTYTLGQGDVGKVISVTASYLDGGGKTESVLSADTLAVTNVNDKPTGIVTIDKLNPLQGDTLTASNTLADADGMGAITYTWKADGVVITTGVSTTLGNTYILGQSEVGKTITVTASYTDGDNWKESVSSVPTKAVINVNDAPTSTTVGTGVYINNLSPVQGEVLTASHTLADADGLGTITYEWRSGSTVLGTGPTYTLGQNDVGKTISVTASYIDGHGFAESVTSISTTLVGNINDAPTGSLIIDNLAPKQGDLLTAVSTLADADGMGVITYTWKADGVTIIGSGTGSTHILSQSDVGKLITVTASYIDGTKAADGITPAGKLETVTSASTAAVINVDDAPTGGVTITSNNPNPNITQQGDMLTAVSTLADADGMGIITYTWKADGVTVASGTGNTHLLSQADVGKIFTVTASYTDGATPIGKLESITSAPTAAIANVNDAPTGTLTINNTAPKQGDLLTAISTLDDADGMGTITYTWKADGAIINGTTGNTYTLGQGEVGKIITVTAGYTDGGKFVETIISAPTAAVINVNDAPTGGVTITSNNINPSITQQGDILTAVSTLADADGMGAITYTWKADGLTVGTTGNTHLLSQADVGKIFTVTASYTDGATPISNPESVTSAPTAPIANVNDAPTGGVIITNTTTPNAAPQQGDTLTADVSTLKDLDGLGTISYTWQADGVAVGGAGNTYTLGQSDVGKVFTVTASYTDTLLRAESVTSAPTAPIANVNDNPTGTLTIDNLTPSQGQTLTAISTLADIDGIVGPITYTWKSGSTILGTGPTYTLGQSDVNKIITVTASYTDGGKTVETVTSPPTTAAVANVNEAPTGSLTITGTVAQNSTLTAVSTLADTDGMGTIAYTWHADGVTIAGATNATYTLGQSDVNKVITVTASYIDGGGKTEIVTSLPTAGVTNVNDAPTGGVIVSNTTNPVPNAAPQQGNTLAADVTSLGDIDGLGTITYTWKADGVTIIGAVGATHVLSQNDVNKAITVTASYTDGFGRPESVTSVPTATVANVDDAPTGLVIIDNLKPEQGQILTASNTLADIDGMNAVSYAWTNDGGTTVIGTGSTYTLVQGDVGKFISVIASYTDAFGKSYSIPSDKSTYPVINVNDKPTGFVAINNITPKQGDLLTAVGQIFDADGTINAIPSFTWKADGVVIQGAIDPTYTLVQSDVGKAITVTVSYIDDGNTHETMTSAATGVVGNINDTHTGGVTIDNLTPSQGQTLTAISTLADADGMGAITYTWKSGNAVLGTGPTYTLGQIDVGKAITVTASYTDGGNFIETAISAAVTVANVNDAPTGSLTINNTAPKQGDVLTAVSTLADADGMGTVTYTWKADGVTITGTTGDTYTLGQNEVGKAITVTASYADLGTPSTPESVTSLPTKAVVNVNDPHTGSLTITGTVAQNSILTAVSTLADIDVVGPINLTYTWQADGVTIVGATSATYTPNQGDVNKAITVTASYTDAFGRLENVTSLATGAVANVNDLPTGEVTIDNLNPQQGQTLTASNTLADIDGMNAVSYAWNADGVAIVGATGKTYILSQSDVGKVISVTASYTDGFGNPASVPSVNNTFAVANVNDKPTGIVTIDNLNPQQGDLLTASNTLADADGMGANPIVYTWKSGNTVLSTGPTYLLGQSDVGKEITVTASYTDGGLPTGTAETMTSAATGVVGNSNDPHTGGVTIDNLTPSQGQTLTAISTLADLDGMGAITYTWKSGINILGTGPTYTLGQIDVGKAITVTARYTDGGNFIETAISTPTAAVANVNDRPTGSLTITGTVAQNSTLTAVSTLADADGMGAVTYTWKADGTTVASGAGNTYTLGQSEVGKVITVTASYADLGTPSTPESVTSLPTKAVINVNDAPTGGVTITNTTTPNAAPQQGDTLTAGNNIGDIDGMGAITYTWNADGVAIVGAVGATHVLSQSDVGKVITVTASYTDGQNNPEVVTSSQTASIANVNDKPTGRVTIDNINPQQGDILTASNNIGDLDGMGVITYTWNADGIAIVGAVGATHVLSQSDVGKAITVTASYTDGAKPIGTPETVTSSSTAAVVNVAFAPTGSVTIDNTSPAQGSLLTAISTLADADSMGAITYTWKADGAVITAGVSPTGNTYLLGQAEVNKIITVTASYVDGDGLTENVTSAPTFAVTNVNDKPTGGVTIDNINPAQGDMLTANISTLADADGLGVVTYTWSANGVVIAGATANTYTLSQSEVGKTITVTASYTDLLLSPESVSSSATNLVTNTANAPTGGVTIDKMSPAQGDLLTVTNNLVDADGLSVITYTWQADGVTITGAIGSTYTLGQSEVNKLITVIASYTDGDGLLTNVPSVATDKVTNVNDSPTGSITITGTVAQNSTLTAVSTLADVDGMGTIIYEWKADGVVIAGSGASNTYTLSQNEVDKVITVTANYADGFNHQETATSAPTGKVTNVNDVPTGGVTIDNTTIPNATPSQGQTLTANITTLADADGLGQITYQWKSGGAVVGGTGNTYTLSQSDVNKAITVKASYTDGFGRPESVTSAPTNNVINANDAPTGSVTIDNANPSQGQTLTASNTLADLDGLGSISYIWKSGATIVGNSGNTYKLLQSDVGQTISVTASYTDGFNNPETVTSAPTSKVANVNDLPTGSLTITGTVAQNSTLTAVSTLADADGMGAITYTWKADGATVATGAGNTYTLGQSDVGKVITVTASYADLGTPSSPESVTSAPTGKVANVNDLPVGNVTISNLTPTQGDVLTVSNNLTDADGMGTGGVSYTWMSGANAVATGNSYTLVQSDVGKVISVIAKYTDATNHLESVTSIPATNPVIDLNDAPVLAAPATINYVDTQYVDSFATATGTLVGTDPDVGTILTYGVSGTGVVDNGTVMSISNAYGTLTVTKATGAYSFVPNSASIEPLGANTTSTFTVTVSDGLLTTNKPLTVAITQNGVTETNGNDNLVGTVGSDTWAGLAGDDTYTVNNVGDVIIEQVGGGLDTVNSSSSYTLSTNIETLILTGTAAINGTGSADNNNLIGNSGNNILDGGLGADSMTGGIGSDTYYVDNLSDMVVENANEGIDTVLTTVDGYTLTANVEQLILRNIGGTAVSGYGNTLNNTLRGNDLNNILDGLSGADTMIGLLGDDSYYVDDAGDVVTEALNEGLDTVNSSISYTLGANLEALILTGTAAINGNGNELNNQLTGNSGNNTLWGGAGNDTMAGGLGNDTYNVDSALDVVNENAGEGVDIVNSSVTYTLNANIEKLILTGTAAINGTGNADNNNLIGNSGNNILDGGLGIDTMAGGLGNDTYYVDTRGDLVVENANEGIDTVLTTIDGYTLTDNVEQLILRNIAGTDLNGYGNALNNTLRGNNFKNLLDGGAGADTLIGGLGDDTYYVDNIGDVVTELAGEGIDTVYSSISYTLGDDVENLVLRQMAGINLNGYGNTLNNNLRGNDFNNILDGGAGADTMAGLLGNDTYNVDNILDVVNENAGEGVDIVNSSVTYTLSANVEQLILTGAAAINGTGSADNNSLTGNIANNTLTGGDGADILTGGLGNDTYNLTETTDSTDTLRIATGDSLGVANHDIANNFKLGTGLGNTLGVDRLDLDTTTIAANAAAVNGIDVANILSHSISNGIISFDDAQSYAAPMTISSGDLTNVINYLRANITGGNTVAFIDNANHTYVFQDGGTTDTFVELVGVTATSVNNSGLATDSVWII